MASCSAGVTHRAYFVLTAICLATYRRLNGIELRHESWKPNVQSFRDRLSRAPLSRSAPSSGSWRTRSSPMAVRRSSPWELADDEATAARSSAGPGSVIGAWWATREGGEAELGGHG